MEIESSKKYEETEVVLKLGEDFKKSQLKPYLGGRLLYLPPDTILDIAKRNGFDKWEQQDYYDEIRKCIKASFRKRL